MLLFYNLYSKYKCFKTIGLIVIYVFIIIKLHNDTLIYFSQYDIDVG